MTQDSARRNSMFYELGLALLALVSVAIGVYDMLVPRTRAGFTWIDWLDLSIVGVFILDFGVEARRRGSLRKYARENWWELPSLIPITGAMILQLEGFSIVRALRLVRVVRFLRVLRIAGVAARLREAATFAVRIAQRAHVVKFIGFAIVTVAAGSVAAFFAERSANSRLAELGDSLWWALNMFTNVAYVDFQTATTLGRVIAGILEFIGIAFIGVFAGSIANALLREPEAEPRPETAPTTASRRQPKQASRKRRRPMIPR